MPHRTMDRVQVQLDSGSVQVGDMSRLPGAHQHIALVPQWDFLDMLADAAEAEPTFTLRRNAEVDRAAAGRRAGSPASATATGSPASGTSCAPT